MRHVDLASTINEHKQVAEQEKIDMSTPINEIAADAWNQTKAKTEPTFEDSIHDHQQRLITHAKAIEEHGLPSGAGGTAEATEFDKKVQELLTKPAKAKSAKEK